MSIRSVHMTKGNKAVRSRRITAAAKILSVILAASCIMPASVCVGAENPNQAVTMQNTGNIGSSKISEQQAAYLSYSGMSADDILKKLTLEQKICQMIQPAVYSIDSNIMEEYDFGSVLSKTDGLFLGGAEWKDLILDYQRAALSSEAGIPFIYGQDDVHGVNYCKGAINGSGAERRPRMHVTYTVMQ